MRLGWLEAIEYRTEFFIGVIGWSIRLVISLFLWLAVAHARGGEIGGYTFKSVILYFLIVQMVASLIFARAGFDISRDIYKGDFVNYLVKPLNYLGFRLAHEFARNVVRMLFGATLFFVIAAAFFGGIPFTAWKLPLGIVAILGAYFINFALVGTIAISAFWIINASRLTFIYFGILNIFSGILVPLDLFPPLYQNVISWLPFGYIFYFPAKVLHSPVLTDELVRGFFVEWGYAVILMALLTLLYRRGVKRFEAVGR